MDASHQKKVMELQNENNLLRTENLKLKLDIEKSKKDTDSLLSDLQLNNDMQIHEISELKKQIEIKSEENEKLRKEKNLIENDLKEIRKENENYEYINSNYKVEVLYIYIYNNRLKN